MENLIDLSLSIIELLLGKLKNKVPLEIVESLQAAYDALETHKNDLITKGNIDSQRA